MSERRGILHEKKTTGIARLGLNVAEIETVCGGGALLCSCVHPVSG